MKSYLAVFFFYFDSQFIAALNVNACSMSIYCIVLHEVSKALDMPRNNFEFLHFIDPACEPISVTFNLIRLSKLKMCVTHICVLFNEYLHV